ncbi:sensor histidine kinase [Paenibacillus sp. PAMC21692]|uniref:sensor histidine kinase n=1 Tax=Paenibacillus sp. PAMC21692 TaxID=2762320 RepID=UPI00164DFF46|nr:sensor histidine kinase [Paenibacillus sp. PAMC21692]QNK57959.1 sensor histidine kinase [Paenibacillus sp. PAMC21692]
MQKNGLGKPSERAIHRIAAIPARFGNAIRRSRIQNRLIVSFLFLSIVPLTVSGFVSYRDSSAAIHNKISTYSTEVTALLTQVARVETKKIEVLADQFMMDAIVQDGLERVDELTDKVKWDYSLMLNQMLREKYSQLSNISMFQIRTNDNQVFYDVGYDSFSDQVIERFIRLTEARQGMDVWTYAQTRLGKDTIVFVRTIHARDYSLKKLGVMIIAFDEALFMKQTYRNINMGEGADIFIMDAKGVIISSDNTAIPMGEKYGDIILKGIEEDRRLSKPSYVFSMHNGEGRDSSLVSYSYDFSTDWFLVSTIPYAYLNAESRQMAHNIVMVGLLCLLVALLLTFIISRSVSTPVNHLVSNMRQVMEGNFAVNIRDQGKDEIGYMAATFSKMLKQIRSLIEQNRQEQKMKREIELKMLQAQINPHFLFNTLSSLKWTAVLSQAVVVSEGLGALAELLRHTIINKKETITLAEELKNIESYVVIQKIRYGDSFDVEFEIDEQVLNGRVLKFMLQPIVENAIIHGMDGIEVDGKLKIICSGEGQNLKILVQDNGQGMDELERQRLEGNDAKKLSGIGISNVQERIRLHYGDDYGIHIDSKIGEGTVVAITIPLRLEEDPHA